MIFRSSHTIGPRADSLPDTVCNVTPSGGDNKRRASKGQRGQYELMSLSFLFVGLDIAISATISSV